MIDADTLTRNVMDAYCRCESKADIAGAIFDVVRRAVDTSHRQYGRVGRPCWFRLWLPASQSMTDWLPGAWLAWSTECPDGDRHVPVAIVETEMGDVCCPVAENVRFQPPVPVTPRP